MEIKMNALKGLDIAGKKILFRPDINSPIDPETKKIVNDNRLKKNAATLQYMLDNGAAVALIAHQGDTQDYQNLIPLAEHAEKLSMLTGHKVSYIDDVCGPAAQAAVRDLPAGECVILGNLRYLGEELSTFGNFVKLTPEQAKHVWHVRTLAPLFDLYVNDAFSAAHRDAPSMVAFPALLPSAAGFQFFTEYEALSNVLNGAEHPSMFVLGGAKISDAFGMMEPVLKNGTADKILTTGVTGIIMHLARGVKFGEKQMQFLKDRDMLTFVEPAKKYLEMFSDSFELPRDLAFEKDGARHEVMVTAEMPDELFCDVGAQTIADYRALLATAKTIFANGPAGMYENAVFENGTKGVWQAIADSDAYSVIGGGDTVTSATKFVGKEKFGYVCTAGGAMVRFMSGKKLPLIAAMEQSYERCKL
ncbi:phosphoglycerate kinase [Butyricicoccus sp. Marseille-Q5471]|uniref:phosphoglycerate kinase n=1 Tax=Butyricicoccus sp. Marseille-Q5471 TaxID=3039493 RepID=UPI0024BD1FF1|nr:phosphoglycerate kinase [Butyricicoccus sp. Marseille-Q5471]